MAVNNATRDLVIINDINDIIINDIINDKISFQAIPRAQTKLVWCKTVFLDRYGYVLCH